VCFGGRGRNVLSQLCISHSSLRVLMEDNITDVLVKRVVLRIPRSKETPTFSSAGTQVLK
jgi:hypothetical protein